MSNFADLFDMHVGACLECTYVFDFMHFETLAKH